MIKPTSPTSDTLLLIEGAAKHWGHTVCLVLKQHHEDHIHKLMEGLTGRLTGDWISAFQVATRWARRSLPCLGSDTLSVAEALLMSKASHDAAPSPAPSPPVTPPTPLAPLTPGPAHQREPRKSRPRSQRRTASSPGTITETPHHAPTENLLTAAPSAVETRSQDGPPPPPPPIPSTEDDTDSEDSITAPSSLYSSATSSDDDDGTSDLEIEDQEEVPYVSNNTTIETEYAVNRHIRTKDKFKDWDLTVDKTWLIIGDSNVSKVPVHQCPILQIESYPGANFHHALTLFQTVIPRQDVVVKKIIMSFGINSRRDSNIDAQAGYARDAFETALSRFPRADIAVQLVNFSGALHPAEQDTLTVLNELLERRTPTIELIPEECFSTGKDLVHWSKRTGEIFFHHWMDFLNPGPL